jgi:hypothetical protein
MNPAGLRAALRAMRWSPETVAAALAIKPEEVQAKPCHGIMRLLRSSVALLLFPHPGEPE